MYLLHRSNSCAVTLASPRQYRAIFMYSPAAYRAATSLPCTSRLGCSTPSALHQTSREKRRRNAPNQVNWSMTVSYTHLRAHETRHDLVCRLLLEKKKKKNNKK